MAIRKILIANRGEITCRVIRSCRDLGISTVAVYSEADADALHVALADEAHAIGPAPTAQSYLNQAAVLAAIKASAAEAVHPGYGFLAENPAFARSVEAAGRTWIGARPKTIEDMGDKQRARDIALASGVPVLPGSPRFAPGDTAGLDRAAARVGFPLLVKAAAGGGGIGMRRVDGPDDLARQVETTQALAERSFADGTIYLERFIDGARHVEVQVLGLGDGGGLHVLDRDCSVQRRFQKVIEEAPAPEIPDAVRWAMRQAAMDLVRHETYRGAGTVEFIYDPATEAFYFLEMNTRIQVEHAATEMITDLDLVAAQIEIAQGTYAPPAQHAVTARGHAIECRVYAERPEKNFLPAPGLLETFRLPGPSADLRIDHGLREGDRITPHYDPMIAKVIARGTDRSQAIERLATALAEIEIAGLSTNLTFLRQVMADPAFRRAPPATDYIARATYKQGKDA